MDIKSMTLTDSQAAVSDTFRELWMQYYIRMTNQLINIVCGNGNIVVIKKRISESLQDFVGVIQQYYGSRYSEYFEMLLLKYNDIAASLLNAVKGGDIQAASAARTEGLRNADDIAVFLSAINPYWEKDEWQYLIYKHLHFIEEQFIRFNDVCNADITDDLNISNHISEISDYMTQGIIQQFGI